MRIGLWLIGVALVGSVTRGQAAEEPVRYDVPRLTEVNADATGNSWRDAGFRIEALAPVDGPIVPTTDFDALVRVGWSERGLHLLMTVADDVIHVADEGKALTTGDCVEVVVAPRGGHASRFLAAPVVADGPTQVRTQVVSDMDDGWPMPGVIAAARKTGAGYVLELVIPAFFLGAMESGAELGLQLIFRDVDRSGQTRRYAWGPEVDDFRKTDGLMPICLATTASVPCTTAFSVAYTNLPEAKVTLVTPRDADGKRVEVNDGPPLKESMKDDGDTRLPRAIGTVRRIADRYGAVITCPLAAIGTRPDPFNVYLASRAIHRFTPPNLDAKRRAALANLDLVFRPGVFTGDAFPRCDFADPRRARALIGADYRFHTDFYSAGRVRVEKAEAPGRYGAVVRITAGDNIDLGRRPVTLFRRADAGGPDAPETTALRLPPAWGVDPAVVREQQAALSEYVAAQFTEGFNREPDAPLLLAALAEAKPGDGPLAGRNSIWQRDQRWWYPLKAQLSLSVSYQYRIGFPPHGQDPDGPRFPLVLVLHGSGERGRDLDQLLANGPARRVAVEGAKYPFILVAPQCPAGEWWSTHQLINLLDEILRNFNVDPDRVYVTGLSMGGYAAWELAAEYPERFAAVLPICGAGSPADAGRLKDLPVWIVHGKRDAVVPFAHATEMYDALRKAGGRVRLSAYDDAGHDAWTRMYAGDEWYKWLLAQRRGQPVEPRATP